MKRKIVNTIKEVAMLLTMTAFFLTLFFGAIINY